MCSYLSMKHFSYSECTQGVSPSWDITFVNFVSTNTVLDTNQKFNQNRSVVFHERQYKKFNYVKILFFSLCLLSILKQLKPSVTTTGKYLKCIILILIMKTVINLQFPNLSLMESYQLSVKVCENTYAWLSHSCMQSGKSPLCRKCCRSQ